ncbi:desulfoferrodoxin family protein [uncultured Sphaerochaeta sp.]|uniref:desulfoferrodoxin family protein n=1 Tax=uncultured Sphaerochaeta sp. TaxID=886478 RepID=UPI002A0A4150|nr:desulfoferrodoxin family protein [uncultured Sphaerochaeta sp.]
MARKIYFYHCPICNSVVELIENGGHSLTCCDHPMELMKIQESGEGQAYHLPELRHKDGLLYVTIGSKMHPQSEDHYIGFIVFVTKQTVRRSDIKTNGPPTAVFTDKDHGDVYSYCNLHGIWKTSF